MMHTILGQAHPTLTDLERKKVCSLMDCQKLSRQACAHAAQNDRLPVQTVVQVLYYEQQRLRENMNENSGVDLNASAGTIIPTKPLNFYPTNTIPFDEFANLKRENEGLKLELLKLKVKLKEIEKPVKMINNGTFESVTSSPAKSVTSTATNTDQKLHLLRKSFMNSVKKLGRLLIPAEGVLGPACRAKASIIPAEGVLGPPCRAKVSKSRRHSVS